MYSSLWTDSTAAVPQDKSLKQQQDSSVVDKHVEEMSAAAADTLQHDVNDTTLHQAQNSTYHY